MTLLIIHYVGLETLGLPLLDNEQLRLRAARAAERLTFNQDFALRIHVTNDEYDDGRAQYGAFIVLIYDSTSIASDKHHAWDIDEALADAFESLQFAIDKRFPPSVDQPPERGIGKSGLYLPYAEAI